MATIAKNTNYPAGVAAPGTSVVPRDTGSILGTVPPGKAGLKLVDGTQQSATCATTAGSDPRVAGILAGEVTPNVADNFLTVAQVPTFNTAADGYSLAPEHE